MTRILMSPEIMAQQQQAVNEYNSLRAQGAVDHTHPRKFDLDIKLGEAITAILIGERDRKVRELRAQADRLEKLTAIEFVAEGIWDHDVQSFELLGRLAKVKWVAVEYRDDKPGWRVHDTSRFERYVSRSEVAEMLTDSGSAGT